jgi:hypothetical protein
MIHQEKFKMEYAFLQLYSLNEGLKYFGKK